MSVVTQDSEVEAGYLVDTDPSESEVWYGSKSRSVVDVFGANESAMPSPAYRYILDPLHEYTRS